MPKLKDISGQPFGNLTPEAPVGRDEKGSVMWRCRCACGNYHAASSAKLQAGTIDSCGCQPKMKPKEIRRQRLAALYGLDMNGFKHIDNQALPPYVDKFIRKYKAKPKTHRTNMIIDLIAQTTASMNPDYKREANWGDNLIELQQRPVPWQRAPLPPKSGAAVR